MKKSEGELELLKRFIDQAPCSMGLFDIDSKEPVFFNKKYRQMMADTQISYPDLFLNDQNDSKEFCVKRNGKKDIWLKTEYSQVTVDDLVYILVSFSDITEKQQ
ncbi:MAG: hypothetical protein GX567_05110, partial [Clostridia bacterium]|nr:hypothetical protein [Clostridia bacterium]